MYLASFNDNWADEIDIHEADLITEDEYQALRKYLKVDEMKAYEEESCSDWELGELDNYFTSFCYGIFIGTNESIEYGGLGGVKALWEAFEFSPITEDEAAVVRKFNLVGNSHIISGLIDEAMIVSGE